MGRELESEGLSSRSLWIVLLILGLIGLAIVLLTAPASRLLGESEHAIRGALHGTAAGLFMITATIGLFQAYRIFAVKAWNMAELQLGGVVNAVMAAFTILSGNWIYIPYRAPQGPRGRPRRHPRRLIGDKGYDSDPLRQTLRRLGIQPEFPISVVPKTAWADIAGWSNAPSVG